MDLGLRIACLQHVPFEGPGHTASTRVLEKCGLMFSHEYEETRFPGDDRTAGVYELHAGDQEELAAEC